MTCQLVDIVSAVSVILLVLVTACYAISTHQMAVEMRRQSAELQAQGGQLKRLFSQQARHSVVMAYSALASEGRYGITELKAKIKDYEDWLEANDY